jgi:hypothetical protein
VIATIIEGCLDIDHRVASDHTTEQCFNDTLHDRLAVFLWHHTALDFIKELKALA